MKEEALKLAYEMDGIEFYDNPNSDPYEWACDAQRMILRLVEELDKAEERNLKIVRKNEHLLGEFFRVKEELACALDYIRQYQSEERHGIK